MKGTKQPINFRKIKFFLSYLINVNIAKSTPSVLGHELENRGFITGYLQPFLSLFLLCLTGFYATIYFFLTFPSLALLNILLVFITFLLVAVLNFFKQQCLSFSLKKSFFFSPHVYSPVSVYFSKKTQTLETTWYTLGKED